MSTHPPINGWTAGDDWEITATLLDETGAPYDLTSAQIKWALMDANYRRVIDEDDVNIFVIDAAAGKCAIMIPAVKTAGLRAGRYTDVLRIVSGGITSTLSYGTISTLPNPWAATAAA
jgi:hypothetical protein